MNKSNLAKLVGFNTVTSNSNMKLINFCTERFSKSGYKIKLIKRENKANLFAYKKCPEPRMILSAHTDTVPESSNWTEDPFGLTEKAGKYFGLGVCDMKGYIAIMLEVAKKFQMDNLAFLLTFDEETEFAGAKLIDKSIIKMKDIVVIGEPTNNKVISGNKGALAFRGIVKGVTGHGSRPESGISAIEKAATMICQMKEKFESLGIASNSSFGHPHTTYNFGTIAGGDAINKIADKVIVDFEFRTTGNMQRKKIVEMIEKIAAENSVNLVLETLMDLDIYEADKGMLKKVSSLGLKTSPGESYCTEANVFNSLTKNILVFGPGDPSQAHTSDEYIEIEQLNKYEKLLEKLIENKSVLSE